jgi:Trypsin-like peptidase domain/WD domain, G-beta repeat
VEVIADLPGGASRYGSGCIVAGATVLTAAHVVDGALRVWVRGPSKRRLDCHPVDPAFVGHPSDLGVGPDLALVEIDDAEVDLPPMGLARVDRDSTSAESVDRAHAWGYPQFTERPRPDGSSGTVRESCDAAGVIPVGSGLDFGLLDLQVMVAPQDLPDKDIPLAQSPWSGISGGPVFAAERLLGVVTEHAPRAGPGSLAATPLTAIEFDPNRPLWGPGVPDPASWWARLGMNTPTDLTLLPPRPVALEPPYAAELRSMGRTLRTRLLRLEGRQDELAALADFATGTQGYRWLVGGAFSGKTSLMFHAVTAALPDSVDVVSYFLRRVSSDANSTRFLTAVIPQLAALCGVEVAGSDEYVYRSWWEKATVRARERGRHLLLVVDGLDEDLHSAGIPSVASLLPDLVTDHAHVHVTSRPYPELPTDVAANTGHPLNRTARVELLGFPGWEELRKLGAAEVDTLVAGGGLARDVLGLLAAAAGPLSVADLSALHAEGASPGGVDEWDIEDLLTRQAARSLERVGPAGRARYQFAHATLLEQARENPALARPRFRDRLHAWADTWRQAGWPDPADDGTGTPRYLFDTYPATLAEDPERLTNLVGDVGWVDTAIRTVGVDATLAALGSATADGDPTVGEMRAVVSGQGLRLRPPRPIQQPGYVLRQLCLQALEYGLDGTAAAACSRLKALPDPGPIPLWTTTRHTPVALELGGHDGGFRAVAVAPDGRWVVTGGSDGRVRLWHPERPGEPSELGGHDLGVWAVAVAPDGRWVVTGGVDGRVLLWHPERPGEPSELGGRHGVVTAVAVAPDGRWVVTGGVDGRVRLWHPERPGEPSELGGHDGGVWAVAVAPDGRWVVTCGYDRRVRLWHPEQPGLPTVEIGMDMNESVLAVSTQTGQHTDLALGGRGLSLWQVPSPGGNPGT